jgi:hypothetical protein
MGVVHHHEYRPHVTDEPTRKDHRGVAMVEVGDQPGEIGGALMVAPPEVASSNPTLEPSTTDISAKNVDSSIIRQSL